MMTDLEENVPYSVYASPKVNALLRDVPGGSSEALRRLFAGQQSGFPPTHLGEVAFNDGRRNRHRKAEGIHQRGVRFVGFHSRADSSTRYDAGLELVFRSTEANIRPLDR